MKIKIVNKSGHHLPAYSTSASAGMDIRANLAKDLIIKPGKRALVPTGLFLEIPVGYEAQVRPLSGLPLNKGVRVLNSPETIDSDYRDEVCVILINLSDEDFVIKDGDRISQMIISKHEAAEWIDVDRLQNSGRGEGGFGHTGKI